MRAVVEKSESLVRGQKHRLTWVSWHPSRARPSGQSFTPPFVQVNCSVAAGSCRQLLPWLQANSGQPGADNICHYDRHGPDSFRPWSKPLLWDAMGMRFILSESSAVESVDFQLELLFWLFVTLEVLNGATEERPFLFTLVAKSMRLCLESFRFPERSRHIQISKVFATRNVYVNIILSKNNW